MGMPQNMMLVSMVHSKREKQQDTRCTRVKVLQGGRLMTENQMWPSLKSFAVFMKNRLLKEICRKATVVNQQQTECLWLFATVAPLT